MPTLAGAVPATQQVQMPIFSPSPLPSVAVYPHGVIVKNLVWSNLLRNGFRFHLTVAGFRDWAELAAHGYFDALPSKLDKVDGWPVRRPEPCEALIELVWSHVPLDFDDAVALLAMSGHEWINLELFLALAAIPNFADTFPLAGIMGDLWESSPIMYDQQPLPCIATTKPSLLRHLSLRSRQHMWDSRTRFPAIVSVTSL